MTVRQTSKRAIAVMAALLATSLVVAACGTSSSSSGTATGSDASSDSSPATDLSASASATLAPAEGKPLIFGSIGMLTGPLAWPQVQEAIKAYFADWNARGGVNGQPVELLVGDAGSDPKTAANAAQALVKGQPILGLVGNSSLFDCPINSTTYQSEAIANIVLPFDASCNISPQLFPIAGPPAQTYEAIADFALSKGAMKVAFLGVDAPGIADAGAAADAVYAASGSATTVVSQLVPPTATAADLDAVISKLKSAGVDTVTLLLTPPLAQLALQQAAAAGVGPTSGVTWILNSANYEQAAFESFGTAADGAYVECNAYCWEVDTPDVQHALQVLQAANVTPIDGIVGWAWQSAALLESALRVANGDVTRESVMAALGSLSDAQVALAPYRLDLTGSPSVETPRQLPSGGQFVQWTKGAFSVASDYITVQP